VESEIKGRSSTSTTSTSTLISQSSSRSLRSHLRSLPDDVRESSRPWRRGWWRRRAKGTAWRL
jgi:hypothetical protein